MHQSWKTNWFFDLYFATLSIFSYVLKDKTEHFAVSESEN